MKTVADYFESFTGEFFEAKERKKVVIHSAAGGFVKYLNSKFKRVASSKPQPRYKIGSLAALMAAISSYCKQIGESARKVIVDPVKPGDRGSGSKKYFSYRITFPSDKSSIIIVNSSETTSSTSGDEIVKVGKKILVPTALLPIDKEISLGQLMAAVKEKIKALDISEQAKFSCVGLLDIAKKEGENERARQLSAGEKGIAQLSPFSEEVKLPDKLADSLLSLAGGEINNIGNDFGEIVGAVYLLAKYGGTYSKFPGKSNEPLVDYYIDGNPISAKFKTGASPSILSLYDAMKNQKNVYASDPAGKKLFEVIQIMNDSSVKDHSLAAAKYLDTKHFNEVVKTFNVTGNNVAAEVDSFMKKFLMSGKTPDQLWTLVEKVNKSTVKNRAVRKEDFIDLCLQYLRQEKGKLSKGEKKRNIFLAGYIVSPAAYDVADIINDDPKLKQKLNDILRALKVKQMFITDINPKKRVIGFKLIFFKDAKFELHGAMAASIMGRKIGFRMTK